MGTTITYSVMMEPVRAARMQSLTVGMSNSVTNRSGSPRRGTSWRMPHALAGFCLQRLRDSLLLRSVASCSDLSHRSDRGPLSNKQSQKQGVNVLEQTLRTAS